MSGILRKLGVIFALICVGTVLTEVIWAGYFMSKGGLTNERMRKMLLIAQGVDIAESRLEPAPKTETPSKEFVSYAEMEEARSLRMRNLELREQIVANGLERIRFEQRKVQAEKEGHEFVQAAFDDRLATLEKGALAGGRDQVRVVLENLKPPQSKALILEMMEENAKDDVVAILNAMPIRARVKILSEFKSEQEAAKLSEIIHLIKQGVPEVPAIEKTRDDLNTFKPNQP